MCESSVNAIKNEGGSMGRLRQEKVDEISKLQNENFTDAEISEKLGISRSSVAKYKEKDTTTNALPVSPAASFDTQEKEQRSLEAEALEVLGLSSTIFFLFDHLRKTARTDKSLGEFINESVVEHLKNKYGLQFLISEPLDGGPLTIFFSKIQKEKIKEPDDPVRAAMDRMHRQLAEQIETNQLQTQLNQSQNMLNASAEQAAGPAPAAGEVEHEKSIAEMYMEWKMMKDIMK
jgi:hypothetical protein